MTKLKKEIETKNQGQNLKEEDTSLESKLGLKEEEIKEFIKKEVDTIIKKEIEEDTKDTNLKCLFSENPKCLCPFALTNEEFLLTFGTRKTFFLKHINPTCPNGNPIISYRAHLDFKPKLREALFNHLKCGKEILDPVHYVKLSIVLDERSIRSNIISALKEDNVLELTKTINKAVSIEKILNPFKTTFKIFKIVPENQGIQALQGIEDLRDGILREEIILKSVLKRGRGDRKTLFHFMAIYNSRKCLQFLLNNLSQELKDRVINLKTKNTLNTPLHLAIYHGSWPVASMLLSHGSDPSLENKWGATPIPFALKETIDKSVEQSVFSYEISTFFFMMMTLIFALMACFKT